MTSEQMAALVECVRTHVSTCPERYTQLVIKEMKDRFPDLELNMGQVSCNLGADVDMLYCDVRQCCSPRKWCRLTSKLD